MASSWFPFFGRDFIAATLGWSAEERGHYTTLLIAQWEQDGLPNDMKRLELISPGVGKCWKTIESKFPVGVGGRRRNVRLEHERHLANERSERARQSASARWSGRGAEGASAGASGGAVAEEVDVDNSAENDDSGCDRICDRISDRICPSDASMSISYSPPPPPPPPEGVEGETGAGWSTLRAAWNETWGEKRQWRSSEPPAEAIARLGESGWLAEALQAIPEIKKGACSGFKTPPTLRQFCGRDPDRGSFVSRLLGGEFTDTTRATPFRSMTIREKTGGAA
jgi:uncharacterized protein YdaU (DUF1376 family)